MRCAASHTSRLFIRVPKLQLGNPDDEASSLARTARPTPVETSVLKDSDAAP